MIKIRIKINGKMQLSVGEIINQLCCNICKKLLDLRVFSKPYKSTEFRNQITCKQPSWSILLIKNIFATQPLK